jgi:hypothetical protein
MSAEDRPEQPRAPRLELYAVVAIQSGKRRVILTVLNLSESGVLLEADEDERGKLVLDSTHDISVFDRDHEQHRAVTVQATVVRHDERGIALTWRQDDAAVKKIARLIETLKPRGP